MSFVQVLPKSGGTFERCSAAGSQGTAAAAAGSGAIKISQQPLIGFRFDVRRHSPRDGETEALLPRDLSSISGSESPLPTGAIQSSQRDTFVLPSFNLNSEVLLPFPPTPSER